METCFFRLIGLLIVGVVSSSISTIDLKPLSFSTGSVGYQMIGPAAASNFGHRGQSAGDFNADGYDDIIIGASGSNMAYLIFGRLGNVADTVDMAHFNSSSTTGFRMVGAVAGDAFGFNADSAGDFNGDGYDDVVVGAQLAAYSGRTQAGTAYVIFGHPNSQGVSDLSMSTMTAGSVGFSVHGPSSGSMCSTGYVAGDMNGDGFDDVVVGCSGLARAYVIFGKRTGFADIDLAGLSCDSRGFVIVGTSATKFGNTGGPIGDYNHDGFDDIFIGAELEDVSGRTDCGGGYVMFGHTNTTAFAAKTIADISSGTQGFHFYGSSAEQQCGQTGRYIGDFNADGVDDFAINCFTSDPLGRANAGAVYVFFGNRFATTFTEMDLASFTSSSSRGFRIWGAKTTHQLTSPSDAGDVNGDGIDDLIMCSVNADTGSRANGGVAYVMYGHRNTTSTFADVDLLAFTTSASTGFRILGPANNARFCRGSTGVGDVNGDGMDDIYMGGWETDELRADSGSAYVIYGVASPTTPPSAAPTIKPTLVPTIQPSRQPTAQPSAEPTSPTSQPSQQPSGHPSAVPSTQPTAYPSTQPSSRPSCQPTSHPSGRPSSQPAAAPSSQPSSQPTVSRVFLTKARASPTYKVRNGFAFAVTSVNGTVHTWGEGRHGGDFSAVQSQLLVNVTSVIPARFAYTALKDDGSVVPWGVGNDNHILATYPPGSIVLTELFANEVAFAGIDAHTGGVVAFGSPKHGGNVLQDAHCNGFTQQLSANIVTITATAGAFAALSSDGSVYVWGSPHYGGRISADFLASLPPIALVTATRSAFAVLSRTGRVFVWGDRHAGGDTSAVSVQLAADVIHVFAAPTVFVAFKKDASIVAWGNAECGGDASAVAVELSANITFVAHTYKAMAALKADGSVVTWGAAEDGGDSSAVQAQLHDVEWIYGNSKAFAALTTVGKVVAWGKAAYGGQIPSNKVSSLSSGVVSIYNTDRAFAALKDNGWVVVWGQAGHGGSPGAAVEAHLVSGVHTICANDVAFSVIKTDGSVVGWGHPVSVPVPGVLFTSSNLTERAVCS